MRIRSKFSLIMLAAWIMLVGATFLTSIIVIFPAYKAIERQQVKENVERINLAINTMLNSVFRLNKDWAYWDDTYVYIQNLNKLYEKSNLQPVSHTETNTNFILYFNKEGNYVSGRYYDIENKKYLPLPNDLKVHLSPDSKLLKHENDTSALSTILKLKDGILLLSSAPILSSDKKGPIRGTLIMARFFGSKEVKEVANTTRLPLLVTPIEQVENDPFLKNAMIDLSKGLKFYSQAESNTTVIGVGQLLDFYNKPAALFKISLYRNFVQQGKKTIFFLILFMSLSGLFIVFMLWLLIKYFIINHLYCLSSDLKKISTQSRYSSRVQVSKSQDELSETAQSVNILLDVIQVSHEQLENRVAERTKELSKANTLLREEVGIRKKIEQQLRLDEEKLDHMAHYDALTGLPNRALFNALLLKMVEAAERDKKEIVVLFLDIDKFKTINDLLGHALGDECLQIIADRFKTMIRGEDTVSRIGGDEFLFYFINLPEVNVESKMRTILEVVNQPFQLQASEYSLTASIGISRFPDDGKTLEELISNADMAMYKAKAQDGNTFAYHSESMNQTLRAEIELERHLKTAIQKDEFLLYFQPIINIKDRTILGFEALARWQHPTLGLLLPGKFISPLEKSNLIIPFGMKVLKMACQEIRHLTEKGLKNFHLAVNFSTKQFFEENFLEKVDEVLNEVGISAEHLVFEITESLLMEAKKANEILLSLRERGIQFSVDDFGTGYSSLSYLKQFPIQYLKVDQSFVRDIPNDKDSCAIVNAIIVLGQSLNLLSIAEGIETEQQYQYLKDHGCEQGQGFLFSHPMSAKKIDELLENFFRKKEEQ